MSTKASKRLTCSEFNCAPLGVIDLEMLCAVNCTGMHVNLGSVELVCSARCLGR